jgi:succinylarginine dihydrolase
MTSEAHEVNFDGLIGPTYNHAILVPGNLASVANKGRPGNPKVAALEGLAKAETLAKLGVLQAVLPPHPRPHLRALYRLGLLRDPGLLKADDMPALAAHLAKAAAVAPGVLAACFSPSSCWCANAATVSPSADTSDRKVHFTPANMSGVFSRSLEGEENGRVLRQVFGHPRYFAHHAPLPSTFDLGDEGAANLLRFATRHSAPGLNVFVYGREATREGASGHDFPPRQTRLASEAIARLHGLDPMRVVFLRQNVDAVAAGAFHCDVVAGSHRDILFCHERAFADQARALAGLADAFAESTGGQLEVLEVREAEVTLDDAIASYLFNSQIVNDKRGNVVLVAPCECRSVTGVRRYLDRLFSAGTGPFDRVEFVDTRSSMRNGGGPACLRLRVVLNEEERAAVAGGVFLTQELAAELRRLIETDYPEVVTEAMFSDAAFLRACLTITARLYRLLGLAPPAD